MTNTTPSCWRLGGYCGAHDPNTNHWCAKTPDHTGSHACVCYWRWAA